MLADLLRYAPLVIDLLPPARPVARRPRPSTRRPGDPATRPDVVHLHSVFRTVHRLQPSRVEGLSVALVEAMTLGVPCAVSGYVGRSLDMDRHGTALVLDDAPAAAAAQLAALLTDRPRAKALGARAASYAARHFAPGAVAEAHLAHYARLASSPSAVRSLSRP